MSSLKSQASSPRPQVPGPKSASEFLDFRLSTFDFQLQLEGVVRAVAIHSPTTYSWFGKASPQLLPQIRRVLTPKTARSYLLYNLQGRLYSDFYCKGAATPPAAVGDVAAPALLGVTPFVEEMSAANSGQGYWEEGWEVRAVEEGVPLAHRGGLELRAPNGYVRESGPYEPGMPVSLRFPKEYLGISPGFYMAAGDNPLPSDGGGLVRFYWHLDPEGAVRLMRLATEALNGAGLPFRLKALNAHDSYRRCDSAVLYVPRRDYGEVARIVEGIYPELLPNMKQAVPALTKPLAPGLGFAEDPGGENSFGQHRCRLIAEGLLLAHEAGISAPEERLRVVIESFSEAGVSLDTPYLNPGSEDVYQFHPRLLEKVASPRKKRASAGGSEAYLRAAAEIGAHLAKEAVWYDGQCNWMGAQVQQERGGYQSLSYRALGPDMYGGTSGIALFLAELHAVTGDHTLRDTALGAIRQAITHVDKVDPIGRLGLHSGWHGIALSAARVGTLLGEGSLIEAAHSLTRRIVEEAEVENGQGPTEKREFDLLAGRAGAVVGMLALRSAFDDPSLTRFAARMGDSLLESAEKRQKWYSWKAASFKSPRNLTGLSHGTAGVGLALVELYRATRDDAYLQGAQMAFAYERAHFDAQVGNWPDFRGEPGSVVRGKGPRQFALAWCHGAPGIALSRLRAHELLGDEIYRQEALTAMRTTHAALRSAAQFGQGNYSLCHGLAGNAEALLHGEQLLGDEWRDAHHMALEIADMGIEAYASSPRSWPSGAGGGENPSLMIGLAGTGLFYLRLANPSTPSVLLV